MQNEGDVAYIMHEKYENCKQNRSRENWIQDATRNNY